MKEQPPTNTNKSLNSLLGASKEQLEEWSSDRPLPQLEELESDTQEQELLVARALYTHKDSEAIATTESRSFLGMFSRPLLWVPSLAGLFVLIWMGGKWFDSPNSTHVLTAKGHRIQSGSHHVVLHLGVWSPSQKKVKRVGHGEQCSTSQRLVFGFTVQQPGGYVYLLLQNEKKQSETLFPPGIAERWKPGYTDLKVNNIPQQYRLSKHKGTLVFAAVQTSHPLTALQLREVLKQKSLFKGLLRLQKSLSKPKTLSADLATLRIVSP